MEFDVIDNEQLVNHIPISSILNNEGITQLRKLEDVYPEIGNYNISKVFPNLSTKDTLSIARNGDKITIPPFWSIFRIELPSGIKYHNFIKDLNNHRPLIAYAEPDFPVIMQAVPNDTLYHKQRSLNDSILVDAHINVEEAWDIETGEPWVKVGIHDDGIDSLHPDTGPALVFGGTYNFGEPALDPQNWGVGTRHGNLVSSIVGAKRNNITGMAGIAGGNDSTELGVSLFDMKFDFFQNLTSSYLMASVVDGARSVGYYWDYPDQYYNQQGSNNSEYFNSTPGFGLNIGNHSYVVKSQIPQSPIRPGHPQIPSTDDNVFTYPCNMCYEAYLFSLKNGVINIVARGNSDLIIEQNGDDETKIDDLYPQSFPDNWIISVGASGYDGITVQKDVNQSFSDSQSDFYSLYGGNMDIIAPGSDSIAYSTTAPTASYPEGQYNYYSGTSVAAPHVTGVVALLLSHYNQPCYSKSNLSVEDVEYILQESAVDVLTQDYDQISGWGRLDAGAALRMIEDPTKQIVHPDSLISSVVINRDTIVLRYEQAFVADGWGPISRPFPLEQGRIYRVERVLMENTYDFSEFVLPTTQIYDFWPRQSASNATGFFNDTIQDIQAPGGLTDTTLSYDIFNIDPYVIIDTIDTLNRKVRTRGYFYHFIDSYFEPDEDEHPDQLVIDPGTFVDNWLPDNPENDQANLPFSIYVEDESFGTLFRDSCDSVNLLYDENYVYPSGVGLNEYEEDYFSVYPNPFSENIIVDLKGLVGVKELSLIDVTGRRIANFETDKNMEKVDTQRLLPGIYFIHCILNGESIGAIKMIKQ